MSAARFVRVTPTRIACPHHPDLTLVRFDFDRTRRKLVLQLADIEAPELGPSERTFACLVALGITRWRRGANGLRGCEDSFRADLDGEGTVRDILVSVLSEAKVSMRVELWDSLGWIQVEAAAVRAYLRGSYVEPAEPRAGAGDGANGAAAQEGADQAAPSAAVQADAPPEVVHRDLYSGEPFDPGSPFAELLD